jgi:hypothetical protein
MDYICNIDQKIDKTWILKKTNTWITFEFTDENTNYWTRYKKWDILKCKFNNQCKHNIRDWLDWTYTIYPYRQWVPYYLYPKKTDG